MDRKWYERNKFLGPRRVNERASFFLGKDPRTMAYDTITGYMIYSYKPIVPIMGIFLNQLVESPTLSKPWYPIFFGEWMMIPPSHMAISTRDLSPPW